MVETNDPLLYGDYPPAKLQREPGWALVEGVVLPQPLALLHGKLDGLAGPWGKRRLLAAGAGRA